ncbi:aspergillopepsin I [Ranunculus cassubicifolius]
MSSLSFYLASILLLHLTSNIVFAERNGLSIKLIHRDSIESPLYPGNLTHEERITRIFHQASMRLANIATRMEARNKSMGTYHPEQIRPIVLIQEPFFLAVVGLGTFNSQPEFKAHFFMIDTGSHLLWVQCQGCQKCFYQKKPFYPYQQSSTYRPITCNEHDSCGEEGHCRWNICTYEMEYGSGSESTGYLGRETLTFASGSSTEKVANIIMGCGMSQTNFQFGLSDPRKNEIDGILGLGNNPGFSFIGQLGRRANNIFSHCFPPWSVGRVRNTWLRFGVDANFGEGQRVSSTPLFHNPGYPYYYLQLQDISIGGTRMNFRAGTFTVGRDGSGGCVIDTGSPVTYMHQQPFDRVTSLMASMLPENLRVKLGDNNYCYRKTRPFLTNAPSMIFHFQGADYEVYPRQLFVDSAKHYCLAIVVQSENTLPTLIGNHMQVDYRIMYNLTSMRLSFASAECING